MSNLELILMFVGIAVVSVVLGMGSQFVMYLLDKKRDRH